MGNGEELYTVVEQLGVRVWYVSENHNGLCKIIRAGHCRGAEFTFVRGGLLESEVWYKGRVAAWRQKNWATQENCVEVTMAFDFKKEYKYLLLCFEQQGSY